MNVHEQMQETFEKFKEKLNNKLEFDEDIEVNSVDELVEKYISYMEEDYQ